jgi:polyphosphate kinase
MQETTPDKRFIYKDREVDWLSFNERVLQESADPLNPVYERLKFLAIFSSNLDEFFKVRISKLRQIKKVKKDIRKPLGLKPNKLLKTLLAEIDRQQNRFGEIFRMQILPELADHHIYLLEYPDYTEKQKSYLFKYFEEKIARDLVSFESREVSAEAFDEGELYILLYDENSDDLAFVRVPTDKIGRFIEIPGNGDSHNYTFLEDALKLNAHHIVPDMTITSMWNIKISKDAELYLDDDYEGDWVEQIYDSLAKRQSGQPTRLLYEKGMPKNIRNKLRDLLGLGKIDMFPGGDHHNFSDFFTFPNPTEKPALVFEPLPPLLHRDFEGVDSIFESIQKKDRLIHFHYQSFGYLENWLIEESEDP